MKKIKLLAVLSLSFFLGHASLVSAEVVAVKGNLALILENVDASTILNAAPVTAEPLSDTCVSPIAVHDSLEGASAVVIEGDYAVVTFDPDVGDRSIVAVDITSCLPEVDELDPLACVATVDIDEGEMTIPCIEANGETYNIQMERRGNSDNWEVSFVGVSPLFSDDDDDDLELDDDDDDDEPELEEESDEEDS